MRRSTIYHTNCIMRSTIYHTPQQSIIQVIKSRRVSEVGHVAHKWERRGAYIVLAGRPDGKRPLGRPDHRWE
jgi:hypothetical protein